MASNLSRGREGWEKRVKEVEKGEEKSLREIAGKPWNSLLLFPDDSFCRAWSVLLVLLLLYSILVTPYRVAFIDVDSFGWLILDTTIDFFFFIDLLLSSILVYSDDDHNLVTSHKRIFVHYLKTWFFVDLCACFPLQLILDLQLDVSNVLRFARFARLYKAARMLRILRMFKLAKNGHQILRYMSNAFMISLAFERLFRFLVTLAIVLHVTACGWVFIGRFSGEANASNWILTHNYSNVSDGELYTISLYWTVATIATVGYGDIYPCNQEERIFNTGVMLLGVCVYSYLIGSITNLLNSLDARKAKLTGKLQLLSELSKDYSLNRNFREKLARAVEYEHRNVNRDIDELTATLPTSLRNQLLLTIHRKKIEKNAFFENKAESFVASIVPFLKPFLFDEDEIVYRESHLAAEMYFVVAGEVEFVVEAGAIFICYVSVSANYYFGELDLLFSPSRLRMHTTRTAAKTELLALDEEHFKKLLSTYTEETFEILMLAGERRLRIEERKRLAVADYEARNQVDKHYSVPLQLEERKEKTAHLAERLTAEGAATPELRLAALSQHQETKPLLRLNTFGDRECSRFSPRRPKAHGSAPRDRQKAVLDHIIALESSLSALTLSVSKMMKEQFSAALSPQCHRQS